MRRNSEALIAFIDSRRSTPHKWGRKANDCMSFVAGAVKAQTGKDPARGLRWSSEHTGLRLLKELGGIESALDARFERIAPSFAQRGDIAGVPDDTLGIHPMIVEGEMLVGPGEKGNRRAKRSAMICAWSAISQKHKS